jgi:phosphatidylglycerol:prolipoprotein diacylglycerol transferase
MFPVIDFGPLAIQAAGLLLILSIWLGLWLSGKFAARLGTNGDVIENGIMIAFLVGIVAARLGFALTNPTILKEDPLSLLSLTPSMLDANFGLLAGLLVLLITFQKKHLPLWPTLDTLSPLFILAFAGIQLANLANGNAYGLPTDLPWSVSLWNADRHPVQIYALILTVALLVWWFIQTRGLKQSGTTHSGVLFSITVAALAFITLFTQAFVADKQLLFGFDQVQWAALILLAGSLFVIYQLALTQAKPVKALISMGANVDPLDNLYEGSQDIASQFKILKRSSVYKTEDTREDHQGQYYHNRVLQIETTLPFTEFRASLKAIEKAHGREPGNRDVIPLDLDIITFNNQVFRTSEVQIPDPGILTHGYINLPLAEIIPDFRHPATGLLIENILSELSPEEQNVQKIEEVQDGTEG